MSRPYKALFTSITSLSLPNNSVELVSYPHNADKEMEAFGPRSHGQDGAGI